LAKQHGRKSGATCDCQFSSPIIIDIEDEGFQLTSAEGGVNFDIGNLGNKQRVAWTDARYHNAFLVLDRNGDGLINDGAELFGSASPQPKSNDPNGFRALAEFDKPESGGNGDGVIDARDAIWSRLRLWVDSNHDGISQPEELLSLEDEGVYSISLEYKLTPLKDEFGNQFVQKGRVNMHRPTGEVNRTVYDIQFVLTPWAESLVNGSLTFNPEWPILGLIHKFKGWEYEREWRVLSVSQDIKPDHDWPVPTPTRVFVGSKMEMANKQAFQAICEPKGIEVLEMHRADDSFKLLPAPFSQIEAGDQ
jgi:hypothetical protein